MDDFSSDPPAQTKKDKVRIKIRREEREYFPKLFDIAKTKGSNKVSGDSAVLFFRKSRLSPDTLTKIWSLAAQTDSAYMDRDEFYVALRLVALAQSKREVSLNSIVRNIDSPLPYFDGVPMPKVAPPTNPSSSMMNSEGMMNAGMMNAAMMNAAMMNPGMMNPAMMNSGMGNVGMMNVGMPNAGMINPGMMNPGMMNPGMMGTGMNTGMMGEAVSRVETKVSPYAITQQDADKYSRIYDALDKGRVGSITADQMTLLLKKTNLPYEVLEQVWELAEADDAGNFDKLNVIMILHLLIKHKAGINLPKSIPLDLKSAVQGFLQGRPIVPPVANLSPAAIQTPSAMPMVPAIMPTASDPSDPFAVVENGQAFAGAMYGFPTGIQSMDPMSTVASGMGTENSMMSEGIKAALQELQTLNPEKERLKNSIAMYRDMLIKEEEILNAQMAAFRDVAAEYNDMLKKVSGSGGGIRETGHYGANNGGANWNAGNDQSAFDFS